jgi:hypothetical protein
VSLYEEGWVENTTNPNRMLPLTQKTGRDNKTHLHTLPIFTKDNLRYFYVCVCVQERNRAERKGTKIKLIRMYFVL